MRKTTKMILAIGIAALALVIFWIGAGIYSRIPRNPQEALAAFYRQDRAEDQLMDPLILAGKSVVPLLEKDLIGSDMPLKRYAIAALGNIGSKSALPVLETLSSSESEPDYVRCDALAAIGMIHRDEGLRVARTRLGKGFRCFGHTSGNLEKDYAAWLKSEATSRSYFEALLGWHG